MEENILCARFPGEELNVVNNQHIDDLVEMNKIISGILFNRFYILLGKLFSRDIEDRLSGNLSLFAPNGVRQVFPKPTFPKIKKWIK